MKSKNKVDEFNYVKNKPKIDWSDPQLKNMEFWGLSYNSEYRIQRV